MLTSFKCYIADPPAIPKTVKQIAARPPLLSILVATRNFFQIIKCFIACHDLCESFAFTKSSYALLEQKFKTSLSNVSGKMQSAIRVLFSFDFFFYQIVLSQTLMIHRTARQGRGLCIVPLYHFHPLKKNQTLICNFTYEMTITYF